MAAPDRNHSSKPNQTNLTEPEPESDMKNQTTTIPWFRAALAGVAGTVLFDLVGLLLAGTWWDIPGVLAQAVGVPFPVALLMHYGNGVALAVLYAAVAPSLFGPQWLRGILFVTLETVVLVWFLLFPLLGLGVAGLGGGILYPILSMTRHWAYAVPLIYLLGNDPELEENEFEASGATYG